MKIHGLRRAYDIVSGAVCFGRRRVKVRRLGFLAVAIAWALTGVESAGAATNAVVLPERGSLREPVYRSKPKYCLLSLGDGGEVKVWMVEDGKRLFVDKNANGDLTDDGPPLEPSKVRDLGGNRWDFEYVLEAITPTHGARQTDFVLRRWNYNDPEDSYGLSISVNGRLPMYAGWFGTFWSEQREQAPVVHFGGPFTPKLLRRKAFALGEKGERLSLGLFNPGSGPGAESRLSIDALPKGAVPEVTIEWPRGAGQGALRTTHLLGQRCCYWEFYTTQFEVPKGVVKGEARVSVNVATFEMPVELTTNAMVMPVVSGKREAGLEAGR